MEKKGTEIYIVSYASYSPDDAPNLYHECRVCKTKDEAEELARKYFENEYSNPDTHFGGTFTYECDEDYEEFYNKVVDKAEPDHYLITDGDYAVDIAITAELVEH